VHPDTIVGGIQQLHYSASYGHLLAVEGAYRLRAIPLTDISHRSLTHRQRTVGFQTYTQKPSSHGIRGGYGLFLGLGALRCRRRVQSG
jgi:hypothetical protein